MFRHKLCQLANVMSDVTVDSTQLVSGGVRGAVHARCPLKAAYLWPRRIVHNWRTRTPVSSSSWRECVHAHTGTQFFQSNGTSTGVALKETLHRITCILSTIIALLYIT